MPADPVLNAMWERICENPNADVERTMNVQYFPVTVPSLRPFPSVTQAPKVSMRMQDLESLWSASDRQRLPLVFKDCLDEVKSS